MFASRKSLWRVLALLAAAFLLQSQLAGTLEASRSSADCVQVCNSVRDECRMECETDCAALYPPGGDRDACVYACNNVCIDEMKDCKAKCNVKKYPPCPTEP